MVFERRKLQNWPFYTTLAAFLSQNAPTDSAEEAFKKTKQVAPQVAIPTPKAPPTYAFRIRANRPSHLTFDTDLTRIDYPGGQPGISLSLRASSADPTQSINKAERWVLIGEGYSSEKQALDAGALFQDAFFLALAKARVGIDIGMRAPKTVLTKHGEQFFSTQFGKRVLNDVHGLMVYESEPPPAFLTQHASAVIGRNINIFNEYLSAHVASPPQLTDRERLALQFFHASFFQPTDTRFLLLVMTIGNRSQSGIVVCE